MNDSLATRGFVATAPNHLVTAEGLPITTFRLAASRRRFNRQTQAWENTGTNWYTVTAFRQLALNVASCVSKGDPVIVSGRLSVREWENDDRSGIVVEIDADAVGHDLGWGSASFARTIRSAPIDGHGEGAPGGGMQGGNAHGDAAERDAAGGAAAEDTGMPGDGSDASGRLSSGSRGDGDVHAAPAGAGIDRDADGWALPVTAEDSPAVPF